MSALRCFQRPKQPAIADLEGEDPNLQHELQDSIDLDGDHGGGHGCGDLFLGDETVEDLEGALTAGDGPMTGWRNLT